MYNDANIKYIVNWKVIKSTYPFESPWLRIRMDHIRMPSGLEIPDFYVEELPDWVNVIAITKDGKFLVEEQYRHGLGRVCFELCAGAVEQGESPLDAIKRELIEETGYISNEWSVFGEYAPNTSGCNNLCYTFIATNVEKISEPKLDKTEEIKLHLLNEDEIKEMMLDGRITEAVMLAPLWRYFANKD